MLFVFVASSSSSYIPPFQLPSLTSSNFTFSLLLFIFCLCLPLFNLCVLPANVSILPSRSSGPALWLIIAIHPWGKVCLTPGWLPWSICVCVCVWLSTCVCQGANGQLEGITSLATGITGTSHTQKHRQTHTYTHRTVNITRQASHPRYIVWLVTPPWFSLAS